MRTINGEPDWENGGVSLYLGNCLEILPALEAGSVDVVITDPPYGTTACKWDSVISLDEIWEQVNRIVISQGAIVCTASQPFTTVLISSNLPMFKYTWVWEKENGTNFLNAVQQPLKVHEDIVVFSRAAASYTPKGWMNYHPQMTSGEPYTVTSGTGLHQYHQSPAGHTTISNGQRYPRSILRFNTEKGLHPTQKPVALMEYLMKTYTRAGDTVLDFTMGSGTTGVACVQTSRRFIGIEIDPSYFEIAKQRIKQAQSTPRLPGV